MKNMKNICFWFGIAMVAYDMTGHFFKMLAYKFQLPNQLWNKYSDCIYSILPTENEFKYDRYWSIWFALALFLIIIGRK